MLIISGKFNTELTKTKDFQKIMEEFSLRTGISPIPASPPWDKIMINSRDTLDADMHTLSLKYNFNYLPDVEIMDSLLYPIFISRWTAASTHYTKRSGWQNYQLLYTHSGSGVLNMENHIYELRPNSLCVLDCRPYHYYYANNGIWEYSFIHFSGNTAEFLYKEITKNGIFFTNLKNSQIHQKYNDLAALARNNPDNFNLLFHQDLTSLLVELTHSMATRPETVVPAWLSQIQAFILENYNKDWTVKDLARQSYLSESRFAHVFKEFIGTSPIEYRDYLRIEHAKDFLHNPALSIEKISELTGFHTLSGFYATFTRRTGLTPGKYRKRH